METIATELLQSTTAGTILGLLVGVMMLVWLRTVDRWLADGIDSAAHEGWPSPAGQFCWRDDTTPMRDGQIKAVRTATEVAALQNVTADLEPPLCESQVRRAARISAQNRLDRMSLRWREAASGNPLDPLSRFSLAYRPPRCPDEIDLGN